MISMVAYAAASGGGGWLIRQLREASRGRRLEDLLLNKRVPGLRLDDLAEHVAALGAEIADLRARLSTTVQRPSGHVLFLPTPDGYAIVEADEPPPDLGQTLLLEHGCFRILRVGRAPFPSDPRPCLFLEAVPLPS